ncbi:MAG: MinD/ParA family protein, partial [Chloroflexi bacterium]|nr:MinD/ParA family protein [Chloroflexota bacterium]
MPGMTAAPRILVVCPREEAPEEIRAALSGRYANAQVHWVSQDSLALNRAEDLQVDVVLAYADLGAEATVSLVRRLAQSLPEVAVLVLVPWDGMALARHAVLAGARGFLMQPIDPEELNRSLTEALRAAPKAHAVAAEEAGPRREGQVIVFCAPKGGTGRTTLAVNTALSLRGVTAERAIIVDADWAAPAIDVALNLKHMHDLGDLLPRMAGLDEALVDAVLVEHSTGVKALLAPPPTRGAPLINPAQVQLLFSVLRRMAEWVVVDLGLPLDETAFSFLAEADRVVLNVLPEMIGLRNTRRVLERMLAHGVPRRRILVVVNRATLIGGMPLTDIQGRLGIEVAYQIPDDQPTVTSSVNRGVPLVVDRRYTALARAMREFAQRLVVAAEEAQGEEAEGKAFPKVEEAQRPPHRRVPRWAWAGAAALVVIAALGVLGGPRLAQAWRAQRQAAVPTSPAETPSPAAVAMADGTAAPTLDAPAAAPTAAEPTSAPPTETPAPPATEPATPTAAPATPTAAPATPTAAPATPT